MERKRGVLSLEVDGCLVREHRERPNFAALYTRDVADTNTSRHGTVVDHIAYTVG